MFHCNLKQLQIINFVAIINVHGDVKRPSVIHSSNKNSTNRSSGDVAVFYVVVEVTELTKNCQN
jgi:hypothetical protein